MDTVCEFNVYSTLGVIMLPSKRDVFLCHQIAVWGSITDMTLIILRVAGNLNQLNFDI